MTTRNPLVTYGLSVAALGAAVLLRWLLDPLMGDTLPLVTLFGAVAAAVWLGGVRPAVVVAVLGYAVCNVLFIEPRGYFGLSEGREIVGLLAYLFTCSLIIGFGHFARLTQLEAELRRESLQTTLASIGDAVVTTDDAGRITMMNGVAEALSGWKRDEATDRPLGAVFRIVNEETGQPVENPVKKVLQLGQVQGLANHTVLIARDGTERPIDDSAAPIRGAEGEIVGCVLVFRDVSDRRRGDRIRARLAAIVDSSDDAIISKDLNGIIKSWNPAAERLFGYTAQEVIGQPVTMLIPADRQDEEQHILERLRRGERIEHYETVRRRKDGTALDVSLTVSPVADASGKIVGASKIARDITARKRAEEELREADRRKDEFLAMLAHELRNPLASISNGVQVLRVAGGSTRPVQSVSELLERQVGQMARFVDDLLDVSRITLGKIELRRERLELAPVLHQTVAAVRASAQCKEQEIEVTVPSQPIHVDADPIRLSQMVGNLLSNACKFTDKGGRIAVTAELEDSQVAIRVRDSGIGIAAEQLPRIFGLFVQVDTSLERSVGGLGIGLTLVESLARMHGGSVEGRSEGPGRGSEFVLRLPVALAKGEPPVLPLAAASTEGRRILIVDDNQDGASSLAMVLELAGHETQTVHDGPEAIGAAEQFHPDVVLLDIGLPRLNGYEVCRRIRQEEWGRDLVMVAMTGWGQEDDRHRSRDAGFDAHVVKPVDYDALRKLLASLSAERRAS